jgi:hypothetical protein
MLRALGMTDKVTTVPRTKLQFHYIKGPEYRELLCDGAIGGVTPSGRRICISFYAERGPIPRVVEFEVDAPEGEGHPIPFDETGMKPSRIETREGVVRHIESTVYIDIDVAKRLVDWLNARISESESRK